MSETPLDARSIAAACRENTAALSYCLNVRFDGTETLVAGEPRPWDVPPEALFAPGVAVRIETKDSRLIGLIPAALPLPDWYAAPDEDQSSRLQSLAEDWARLLLPEGMNTDRTVAEAVSDLAAVAAAAEPGPSAELIPLYPTEPDEGGSDPRGTIYLLTFVAKPSAVPISEPMTTETRPAAPAPAAKPAPASPAIDPRRTRLGRLLNVPVEVVVHLAERKIEMGQLLSLSPGALITFEKNCEEQLDLYVNNRLFCRGEAVKIGENFGLKVNELGAVKRREERVF